MKFPSPLIPATFLKRYKRFLVDVRLENGDILTVHCPNTGSMTSCLGEGWPVLLSHSINPTRKYPYTLEMIHNGICWIGINTHLANKIVLEGIEKGLIPELAGYDEFKTEVVVGDSRLDLCLHCHPRENRDPKC